MGKYRDLNAGDIYPASWTDALQEYISSMASANLVIDISGGNAVTVPAGAGDAQVSLGIMGRWRYNIATVTSAAIVGGTAAGTYAVYATASDNVFAANDVDNTVYSFGLEIRTAGTPATALYRKIADVVWDGAAIVGIIPVVGKTPLITPVQLATSFIDAVGVNTQVARRGRFSASAQITTTSPTNAPTTNPADADVVVTQPANGLTLICTQVDMHGDSVNTFGAASVRIDGSPGSEVAGATVQGNAYGTTRTVIPLFNPGSHAYRFVYGTSGTTAFFATRTLFVVTFGP